MAQLVLQAGLDLMQLQLLPQGVLSDVYPLTNATRAGLGIDVLGLPERRNVSGGGGRAAPPSAGSSPPALRVTCRQSTRRMSSVRGRVGRCLVNLACCPRAAHAGGDAAAQPAGAPGANDAQA